MAKDTTSRASGTDNDELDREVLAAFLSDARVHFGLQRNVVTGNGDLERCNEPRATWSHQPRTAH